MTVTDGLQNTAFVSERVTGSFESDRLDSVRDVRYSLSLGNVVLSSDQQFIPLCLSEEPHDWLNVSGRYWMYSGLMFAHYNHNGTPNDSRPSCGRGFVLDLEFGHCLPALPAPPSAPPLCGGYAIIANLADPWTTCNMEGTPSTDTCQVAPKVCGNRTIFLDAGCSRSCGLDHPTLCFANLTLSPCPR